MTIGVIVIVGFVIVRGGCVVVLIIVAYHAGFVGCIIFFYCCFMSYNQSLNQYST